MKHITICCLAFFIFFSCQDKKNNKLKTGIDTIPVAAAPGIATINDSMALPLSKEILTAIKEKNYQKLASFIEPVEGVRFSPYGYVDTTNDRKFSATEFLNYITGKRSAKLNWGTYDGSGET